MKTKTSAFESVALHTVPEEQKKEWWSIALIWIGVIISVPALMIGSLLTSGLGLIQSILAMGIGYFIVVCYMILLGIQSTDLGVPTVIAISRVFGTRGSSLILSIIIAISLIGWFAFQTSVCAASLNALMSQYLSVDIPQWALGIVCGIIMMTTAVIGIGIMKVLNLISVPLLVAVLLFGLWKTFSNPEAISNLLAYQPTTAMPMINGIALAVGGFAVAAVISGDYTRYCKSRKDTIKASAFGVFPAGVCMLAIGGILAAATGNYDITIILSQASTPFLGLLTLLLATWTTNTSNAYSAGLAIVNIFELKDSKRAIATLIAGALGTILAVAGVITYFANFLSILSAMIPPIAGVAIADYWAINKGKPEAWKPIQGFNWIGIFSWAVGAAFAVLLPGFLIPAINAILISFVLYLILMKLNKNKI